MGGKGAECLPLRKGQGAYPNVCTGSLAWGLSSSAKSEGMKQAGFTLENDRDFGGLQWACLVQRGHLLLGGMEPRVAASLVVKRSQES